MAITNITVKNFRSFNEEGVVLDNLAKVNLFIGKNNVGKSNILNFLNLLHRFPVGNGLGGSSEPLDIKNYHKHDLEKAIEFRVTFEATEKHLGSSNFALLGSPKFLSFTYSVTTNQKESKCNLRSSFLDELPELTVREFVKQARGVSGGNYSDRLNEAKNIINAENFANFPQVHFFNEFRQLTENTDLRKRLREIVEPSYRVPGSKQKKERLTKFISEILGYKIEIKIPNPEEEIEIEDENGLQQPISSIGSGIHQVIMLGMELVALNNSIVCIDEPELHMHPTMQRTFLDFVSKDENDNIFFISTHSNSFLDFEVEHKKIFHVTREGGVSKVRECMQLEDTRELLNDLGIRASEILQTNGIIWVEGPSDRIYLKHWLSLINPELEEGLNYTFQYYGGKILSHYSVDDDSFKEFLNMLFVNRNAFIVMDSDMSKAFVEDDLRETKKRIIEECKNKNLQYLVTGGREIENYLDSGFLTEILGEDIQSSRYTKPTTFCPQIASKGKIDFAKMVIEKFGTVNLDKNYINLKDELSKLNEAVKSWN